MFSSVSIFFYHRFLQVMSYNGFSAYGGMSSSADTWMPSQQQPQQCVSSCSLLWKNFPSLYIHYYSYLILFFMLRLMISRLRLTSMWPSAPVEQPRYGQIYDVTLISYFIHFRKYEKLNFLHSQPQPLMAAARPMNPMSGAMGGGGGNWRPNDSFTTNSFNFGPSRDYSPPRGGGGYGWFILSLECSQSIF